MAMVGLEPREKTYEELIEHLEKLELSIPEDAVKKDKPRVTFSEKDIKIPQQEKTHDKKGQHRRSEGQVSRK